MKRILLGALLALGPAAALAQTPVEFKIDDAWGRDSVQFATTALADYQIERRGPVLPLQVGETAHISVSLLASDATAEEAEQYRQNAIKYMGKAAH